MQRKVPTDKACAHHLAGKQSKLNKTTVPHLEENSTVTLRSNVL
jgi:hypothetical protein